MDKPQEKTTDTDEKPKGAFPAVPTTKILAIGRLVAPLTPEQRKAILPREVPDTVRLFLAGKIDQWWSRQDGKGPVFLMNVTSVEEARALLGKLPLDNAKLMEFDFIELGPLSPLHPLWLGDGCRWTANAHCWGDASGTSERWLHSSR
jgi:hypothetical protein